MSEPLYRAKEIWCWGKTDAAFAEAALGHDLRFQFIVPPKEQAFSYSDLAPGANQAFPLVRRLRYLPGEQNLNLALQEVAGGRVARAYRLRPGAASPAVEACGKDPRVIEHK